MTTRHADHTFSFTLRRLTAQVMIALTVFQPMVSMADVVVDAAQAGAQPSLTTAPNGLAVVNIATPNAAGLSHNQYTTFNVDTSGLILNNSQTVANTQLAGYINGNPNLSGGAARLILNEVTSTSRSALNGYMEVAGQAADVIVANPNGITCNGCGFINTTRGVLTTGTPQIDGAGNLSGFRVTGGDISVTGAGLNAANTGQVDLLARAVSIAADINAQNLNIVSGANKIDYASLAATPVTTSGGTPAVGIDVAALGGMYANKIRLVATEAGAGVNSSGTLSAGADGFSLTSQGDVVLAGHTTSGGDLSVSSNGNVSQSNTVYAQGNASVSAGNTFSNSGTIAAQGNNSITAAALSNTGTLGAGIDGSGNVLSGQGDLTLQSSGQINATGQQTAGGTLTLSGAGVNLAGSRNQANNVNYTATSGDIDHQGAQTLAYQTATLSASGAVDNSTGGSMQAGTTFNLNAASLNNASGGIGAGQALNLTAGSIGNAGGELYSAQDMQVSANSLTGDGTLLADNDLTLTLNGSYTQTAANLLHANHDMNLSFTGDLTNQGDLSAGDALTVHAANITNQSSGTLGGLSANLTADQNLTNAGNATADTLNLQAQSASNTGNLYGQNITYTGSNFTNQSTGVVAAGNMLDLYVSNTLSNLDGGLLYSAGNLAIAADANRDIYGWLADPTNHVLNSSATIQAGQDLEITANTLDNQRSTVVTGTRTLSSSTQLIQNWDGGWDPSVVGNVYVNSDTVQSTVVTTTCDIYGANCSSTTSTGTVYVDPTTTLGTTTTGPVTTTDSWGNYVQVTTTTTNVVTSPYGYPAWAPGISYPDTYTLLAVNGTDRRLAYVTDQQQDYVVSASPEAQVLAGRDMYIRAGTVNNIASRVEATGNLQAEVTTLNNTGYTLNNSTRQTTWHGLCSDIQGDTPGQLGGCASGWIWTSDVSDTITGTNTSLSSVFSGGQSLSLSSVTVNNTTVGAQGLPPGGVNLTVGSTAYSSTPYTFSVPSGGLYTVHTDPAYPYLVETDPRFTQYANFISSDYMLSLLGLNPAETEKRLGDGYYEQQLVREQLVAERGKTYTNLYASFDDQYKALLDAGAAYAQDFNITPGIALSKTQVASLSRDMVWLEDRVVSGQHVLVPVVYLASKETPLTGGVIGGGNNTFIQAQDIHNSGTLAANNQLSLIAQHDIINDSGTIKGQTVDLSAGNDIHIGRAMQNVELSPGQTFTHEGVAGSVEGDNVTISANRDVTFAGGNLTANTATIGAGRNLTVGSQTLETSQHLQNGGSRYDRSATTEQGSTLNTTGDLTLVANHDLTVTGSQINSGGALTGVAGNAVTVQASMGHDQRDFAAQSKHVTAASNSSDDTATGSSIHSGGNMTFVAQGSDLNVKGSALTSDNGAIKLSSTHDVNIGTVTEQHASHDERHESNKGFLSGSNRDDASDSQYTVQQGSSLSGNSINVNAGHDATVTASQVVGTQDVNIAAANNLTITTAEETSSHNESHHSSSTGIFTGSGSITWGNRTLDRKQEGTQTTEVGSSVGSLQGNVNLSAGKDYTQQGSSVVAPSGDVNISGKSVDIVEARNTNSATQDTYYRQAGLSLGVSSPILAAAQTAQQMKQASSQTSDPRLQALALATTGLAAKNAYDAVKANGGNPASVTVSLSIGSQQSTSHSEQQSDQAMGSKVAAGGNVSISATGAGKDSNLTVRGSDISAGNNATLTADNAVNILAAQNTDSQHSKNSSSSASIGIGYTYGAGGAAAGITVGVSAGRGNADGSDTWWTNSHVNAGNMLAINSGGDTNLKGAVASGKQVIANVGGDLNIESLQDLSQYDSKDQSAGGSVTFGYGFAASGSFSNQNMHSNFATVTEQSGIKAGDNGFQINVDGNTDLKGAVIASTDKAVLDGKNSLSTGTLTTSDIQNHAEYKAQSVSLGGGYTSSDFSLVKSDGSRATPLPSGVGTDQKGNAQTGANQVPGTALASYNGWSATAPVSLSANGKESSTTQSGISGAAITITNGDKQKQLTGKTADETVAGLNRDVSTDKDGSNALKPIFNQQQIQAGFTIATAFTHEVGTFLNNRAAESDAKRQAAKSLRSQARADGVSADEQRALNKQADSLLNEANQIDDLWGVGGTGRIVLTAISGSVNGNVTGSGTQFIQNAAVNVLQSYGAQKIKSLADSLDSESARTALHGILACAGATAKGDDCGTAALGASASVVVNNLIEGLSDPNHTLTAEEKQAREDLVGTLITGVTDTLGGNASTALNAAKIEMENNSLINPYAAITRCLAKGFGCSPTELAVLSAKDVKQNRRIVELIGGNLQRDGKNLYNDIANLPQTLADLAAHPELLEQLPDAVKNAVTKALSEYRDAIKDIAIGSISDTPAWYEKQAQAEAKVLTDLTEMLAGAGVTKLAVSGGKIVLDGTIEVLSGRTWEASKIFNAGEVLLSPKGNLSAQQITRQGMPAALNDAAKGSLNDLPNLDNTAAGSLREKVAKDYFESNGFTSLDGKCGANNCFDGVYIKGDKVVINEVKPLKDNGSISLSSNMESPQLGVQMTEEWISSRVGMLLRSGDPAKIQAANAILNAGKNGNLVKIVAGLNANGMTMVKIK